VAQSILVHRISPPVHFGLGEYAGRIDVEVTFLTKAGRQVTRVENVEPRSLAGKPLLVRQGEDQVSDPGRAIPLR
jgi:hypothetical protein